MKNIRASIAVVVLFAMAGCSDAINSADRPEPCSAPWYEYVELALSTGDGRGHGPDIGSDEWKSVIEFRLGVRDDPAVPDRASSQWCVFVDRQLQGRPGQ